MDIMIRDGRVLKAMARLGKIEHPIDKGQKYVDCSAEVEMYGFYYKGKEYKIKYLDGCFYPFVYKA